MQLTSVDTLSGPDHIDYTLDGGELTLYAGSVPVSGDGTHTISYRGTDWVGNIEPTRTAIVEIDDTAPDVADDAPTGWVNGPVEVHLSAEDTHSGVADIYYSTDGRRPRR